jgi:hypothetical protein
MAITVRNTRGPLFSSAIAQAHNALVTNYAKVNGLFHSDATAFPRVITDIDPLADYAPGVVTQANASDLPSAIAMYNALQQLAVIHFADGATTPLWDGNVSVGAGAHKVADATDLLLIKPNNPNGSAGSPLYVATGNATTDTTAMIALANTWKGAFNTHIASTTYHLTADSTNTVVATNATTLATLITLLNACKTSLNAHVASAPASYQVNAVH